VIDGDRVLAERSEAESRSHVVSLPGLVQAVLADAGVDVAALGGVAVSIGPGSFTGLRIGLSFAKGLAYAGAIPLVGVPTLEALAHVAQVAPGTPICAALDARKQECWAALFRRTADGVERLGPDQAIAPAALAASLPSATVVVGDAGGVYGDVLGRVATVLPFATCHPRGVVVARLGAARLAAGEGDDPGTLEPTYVRPSEAELARGGRVSV
jgi:tRNA threonylcarbamoyladenosine biosynthesis protein TsaB